jgi:HK97 family phage portal protein
MFITRMRAGAADDRSPWGDFFFSSLGSRTASGQRITADGALQLSAVYTCVRVLTESFAVLPFKLYRPRMNGQGRQLVTDHWAHTLFTRAPNRFQNAFIWRELLQGHLVLRGNSFCEIVDDGRGGVAELLPRHPDRIKIEMLDTGSWRYRVTDLDGSQRTVRRDQMWHIRGLSSDGICGYNPIELARETIGAGLAAQDYGNRFFANDAKPSGGWIEYPGRIADKSARQALGEQIKDAISGQNRHKILTLDQGMKYHEVGVSNKDSQFLESRGYTRTEIAGLFRVPPHMVADLSRATFSNIEQQSIDFWQNTMLPWTERWEAAVEDLIGEPDLEVEFDFRNLMRGDAASRGIYLHNLVLDGVITRNEARGWEGLDPIEGLDVPLIPGNERELGDPDPKGEAGPGEELPDAPPAPADDEGTAARLAQVLRGNAARMARRITAGDPPEAEVLASALAISPSVALAALQVLAQGQQPVSAVTDFLLSVALKGTP